jgi:heptosyltransferase-2
MKKFAKLAEKLIDKYDCVIITPDAPNQKDYINKMIKLIDKKYQKSIFNIAGETNFTQTFNLAEKMDLYISNDTGPVHVAAAMGTKTIGLYGPNTPVKYGAFGPTTQCINIRKCTHKPFIMPNLGIFKEPDHYCLDKISVDEVMNNVKKLLN